jgi:hypothetical protein
MDFRTGQASHSSSILIVYDLDHRRSCHRRCRTNSLLWYIYDLPDDINLHRVS